VSEDRYFPGPYDNLDNDDLRFFYKATGEKELLKELKRRLEKKLKGIKKSEEKE
jgi:hypothetical protein